MRENVTDYREIYPSVIKYQKFSPLPAGMEPLPFNYDQFLNKPLLVSSFLWNLAASQPIGSVIASLNIPTEILNTNAFLAVPWQSSCFYRMKARAIVQTAGTISHAGILLASVKPANAATMTIQNRLLQPHGFLYANQASPVAVEIPFYNNLPLRQTAINNVCRSNQYNDAQDSYACLEISVVDGLRTAVGSTSITVTVHVVIDELEFYVPKPMSQTFTAVFSDQMEEQSMITQLFDSTASILKKGMGDLIDSARGSARQWTGLHNPNLPGPTDKHYMQQRTNPNLVDSVTQYDLLGPYAMGHSQTDAPYFLSETDEMDISYLLQHPQFVDRALVSSGTAANTLLFTRPITLLMPSSNDTFRLSTIQSKLAMMASFWSGDLELVIQACMNNLQFAKLLVTLDYSRNFNTTNIGTNGQPALAPFQGTLMHTLEFAGGGTIKCVNLPFLSMFRQLPTTTDWRANALQHGIVRVYLLQPIVSGGASNTDVSFNFYMKGTPSTTLHGFASHRFSDTIATPALLTFPEEEVGDVLEEQSEVSAIPVDSAQDCLQNEDHVGMPLEKIGVIRPIRHIRDLARRLYPVQTLRINQATLEANTNPTFTVFVSVNRIWRSAAASTTANRFTPLDVLSDLFWGYRGGLKCKVVTYGSNAVSLKYIPPGITMAAATGPIPTLQPTGPASTNTAYIVDRELAMNQFGTTAASGGIATSQYQFPVQESSNYYRRAENRFVTSGDATYQADSVMISDVELPYMSAYDCVTNSSIYTTPATSGFSAEEDMGYLAVNLAPLNVGSSPAVSARYSPISIVIYAGVADDGRFGFLMGGNPLNPAFISDGGTPIQTDPVLNAGPGIAATNVTVPVRISGSGAVNNYYTKVS